MPKIRLTREFRFEMAHALEGYAGLCRHIHGHSYRLLVSVEGEPNRDEQSPTFGMVMDFGELKALVNQVTEPFDHAFLMRRTPDSATLGAAMQQRWERVVLTDYQPTCENLVAHIAAGIAPLLPAGVRLAEVTLYETANSCATFIP